ncbi:MAG: polymer-forming cytoskeletal protein [Minwuia sp.]|nr:polymer-forming cytoskeletal protein [Minwuia sp.]
MFTRKPNGQDGDGASESPRPAPKTSTPMATEDLIARRPRPDIPRPRQDAPMRERRSTTQDEESRLLVGSGISLKGEVSNCAELVIEGSVDARVEATGFRVSPGGSYSGECHVETADIAGEFEGTLNCRDRLIVRSTGKLKGVLRYGEVEIEAGGRIAGEIQVFGEEAEKPEKPTEVTAPRKVAGTD